MAIEKNPKHTLDLMPRLVDDGCMSNHARLSNIAARLTLTMGATLVAPTVILLMATQTGNTEAAIMDAIEDTAAIAEFFATACADASNSDAGRAVFADFENR